jgi:hypothetical protein
LVSRADAINGIADHRNVQGEFDVSLSQQTAS